MDDNYKMKCEEALGHVDDLLHRMDRGCVSPATRKDRLKAASNALAGLLGEEPDSLREHLERVLAVAETMLVTHGNSMSKDDYDARWATVNDASEALGTKRSNEAEPTIKDREIVSPTKASGMLIDCVADALNQLGLTNIVRRMEDIEESERVSKKRLGMAFARINDMESAASGTQQSVAALLDSGVTRGHWFDEIREKIDALEQLNVDYDDRDAKITTENEAIDAANELSDERLDAIAERLDNLERIHDIEQAIRERDKEKNDGG